VHDLALVDDHVNVDAVPLVMLLGLALMVTAVVGAGLTVTVVDCEALPPVPVHVSPYVALALSAPVDCEPLIALLPDHAPEAAHDVAFAALQLSVELLPLAMVLGMALKLIAGAAAFTDTVAD
jgi:hypothetical protein